MSLFLLLSAPLMFLFLNGFYQNDGVRKRDFFIPIGKGSVIYIISLLISWLLTFKLTLGEISFFSVYRYHFLHGDGLSIFLWLILYLIFRLAWKNRYYHGNMTRELLLNLLPLFLGNSIYRLIIKESWYGLNELVFVPLGGMALLTALSVFLNQFEQNELVGKLFTFILILSALVLYGLIPVLSAYHLQILSGVWSLILLGGAIVFFFKSGT